MFSNLTSDINGFSSCLEIGKFKFRVLVDSASEEVMLSTFKMVAYLCDITWQKSKKRVNILQLFIWMLIAPIRASPRVSILLILWILD